MVFKFFDVLVRGLRGFPSTLHVHTESAQTWEAGSASASQDNC